MAVQTEWRVWSDPSLLMKHHWDQSVDTDNMTGDILHQDSIADILKEL